MTLLASAVSRSSKRKATEMKNEGETENKWIVEGLIPRGRVAEIYGHHLAGRTYLALQLAICVASGRDFLGMRVPTARRVAYLNFDLMERSMWERSKNICHALGTMPDCGMLKLYNLRGKYDVLREHHDALLNKIKDHACEFVVFAFRSIFPFCADYARSLILKAREFATVLNVGLEGPQTHPTTFLKLIDYGRLGMRNERGVRKDLVVSGRYTGRGVIPLELEKDGCFVKV